MSRIWDTTLVYNHKFGFPLNYQTRSNLTMIRQLQNAGPTVKIVLGALLVLICASMAITLIPGIGSSMGVGAPPAGVLATIGDQTVTVTEVQREAKAMIRQQFPKGGAQA